ncbi:hypothetical protein BaRGS_00006139, partial [Batillaria attramentaria]
MSRKPSRSHNEVIKSFGLWSSWRVVLGWRLRQMTDHKDSTVYGSASPSEDPAKDITRPSKAQDLAPLGMWLQAGDLSRKYVRLGTLQQ